MNINRAGKQTRAYWKLQAIRQAQWEAEEPVTEAQKAYGQYLRTMERVQGHAQGWIDGIRWLKRQQKKDRK